jgi:Chaperone of endosialidase
MQFNNSTLKKLKPIIMTTPRIIKSIGGSPSRLALVLIPLVFACFALSPSTQAVVPAPDGGYPGGNTAEGQNALFSLTTGGYNTAVGFLSLKTNTTNSFNTAIGAGALFLNAGANNTATGAAALLSNTTGTGNAADGASALLHNDTGSFNTAVGNLALSNNTTGTFNSGFGQGALASNTIGIQDTASGAGALFNNTMGGGNTANGFQALNFNSVGNANTAIGFQALLHNTVGNNNIALGAFAGFAITVGDLNIDIGNLGFAGEATTIRIGDVQNATYVAGISGQSSPGGVAVFVNSDGKLGTAVSSQRFKDDIKSMDSASEAIMALQPVTFRYKNKFDPTGAAQFGLVAEEVEKVDPDLVVCDKEGKPYSVRYDAVNAMLLNEFLKEHKVVQEQGAIIARMEQRIEALTAGLQKVSVQLELNKPAPQTVKNND